MQSFEEFANYILANSKHNTNKKIKDVCIILDYPKLPWGDKAQYMMTLTWFSCMGWRRGGSNNTDVIFAKTLDEAMTQTEKYDYALVSYIGTFYNNYQVSAPYTIHTYFEKFKQSGEVCRGHILWKPELSYPRLHFQSMFLDLNHWRKIGKPSFERYSGEVIQPLRSEENVHDDYTPLWLKPSDKKIDVTKREMAEYISKVMEDGKDIHNFDLERGTKFFTYPERDYCEPLDFERNRRSDIIYTRNTEEFKVFPHDQKYDVIYAPASGNMAEFLWKSYGHADTKVVIYDWHKSSLEWKKMCYNMVEEPSDFDRAARSFSGCLIDDSSYKQDVVDDNLKIFSLEDWVDAVHNIKEVEFKHHDIIMDPVFDVDPTKRNLIHLSNIFSYNFVIHRLPLEQIHGKFKQFVELPNTTVFGKNVFRDTVLNENHSS